MAYIGWPVGVPEYVLVDNYDENFADNLLETSMEQGPYKTRRRGTARFLQLTVGIRMDPAQLELFEEWFYSTLRDGTLPFNWRHPRTLDPVVMQFRKPVPSVRAVSSECYDVQMRLEIVPS
jgi:hypothetical protein